MRLAEGIAAAVREPLLVLDPQLQALTMNPAFAALFQLDVAASQGRPLAALSGGAWQQLPVHQQLLHLLDPTSPAELNELLLEADFGPAGRRRLRLYARRLSAAADGHLVAGLLLGVAAVAESGGSRE